MVGWFSTSRGKHQVAASSPTVARDGKHGKAKRRAANKRARAARRTNR